MKKFTKYIGLFIFLVILTGIFFFKYNNYKKELYIEKTNTLIKEIKKIEKFETTEMTVVEVIEQGKKIKDIFSGTDIDNKIQKFLFEDKLIMKVEGKVIAGIDFKGWNNGNYNIKENNLTIILPKPKILHYYLTDNTSIFSRKKGLLTKGDYNLETKIRNQILEEIKIKAIKDGIIEKSKKNIKLFLYKTIKDDINIDVRFEDVN